MMVPGGVLSTEPSAPICPRATGVIKPSQVAAKERPIAARVLDAPLMAQPSRLNRRDPFPGFRLANTFSYRAEYAGEGRKFLKCLGPLADPTRAAGKVCRAAHFAPEGETILSTDWKPLPCRRSGSQTGSVRRRSRSL